MSKNYDKTDFSDSSKGFNSVGTVHAEIDVSTTKNYTPSTAPRYYRVNATGTVTITDQADTAIDYVCQVVGELIRFSDAKEVTTDSTAKLIATW